jgi:hypothetical protein
MWRHLVLPKSCWLLLPLEERVDMSVGADLVGVDVVRPVGNRGLRECL